MDRPARPLLLLTTVVMVVVILSGMAWGEEADTGEEEYTDPNQKRILVLPFLGPRGIGVRDEVVKTIEERSVAIPIDRRLAKRPVKASRRHNADLMIGGRVRCPNKTRCAVNVHIYRASGQIWRKTVVRAKRSELPNKVAEAAEGMLLDLDLLHEPEPPPPPPEEEYTEEWVEEDEFVEEEPEPARSLKTRVGERWKAVEVYLQGDVTLLRNLCMDVEWRDYRDGECNLQEPEDDDRTYSVSPYANFGARLVIFPGAFAAKQRWWSHLGLYADYSRSILIGTRKTYQDNNREEFEVEFDTWQQDLRVGVIGRIPFKGPSGPQVRVFGGFGLYTFHVDDSNYPLDQDISDSYDPSNPYLPTYSYTSIDVGAEFRIPLINMLWPYTSLAYRAGLGTGQADNVFATDSTTHGVDWELGLMVEFPYGIRVAMAMNLIHYGTSFTGEPDLAAREPDNIWAGTLPGELARDTIFRLRLLGGWSF